MFLKNKNEDVILNIKVIPNAPKNCIGEIIGDMIKIKINAPSENNKANEELVCYLADFFNVKKSDIKLIKGLKSRKKVIQIKNARKEIFIQKLKEAGI